MMRETRYLIRGSREELRICGIVSPESQVIDFLYLGRHGCASRHFLDAQQLFAKTKEYYMAQQELLIRTFSMRAMGEIAYLQKDSTYVKAYFEETASICHDAGIILELLYRRSSLAFFNKVPPATCDGWTHNGHISYDDAALLSTH